MPKLPSPTRHGFNPSPPLDILPRLGRRGAIIAACTALFAPATARSQAPAQPDPWPSLAAQIFDGRPLQDGADVLAIDAPYRAEDAAVVPVTLRMLPLPGDRRQVRRVTLVIDENPSPLAAAIDLGMDSGVTSISTRVRVDSYTNIHAVAEMSDGTLRVATRFVKAAGGCSAPALKQEASAIPLGTLRFRRLPGDAALGDGAHSAVQLMVRHPNYSGMQMDQVTRLYIPADFVQHIRLWHGDAPVVAIESGISISENPQFRIGLRGDAAGPWRAEVTDIHDHTFSGEWKDGATM